MNIADKTGPDDVARAVEPFVHVDEVPNFPFAITPSGGYYTIAPRNLIGATLTWVVSGYRDRGIGREGAARWYTPWIWSDGGQIILGSNELCVFPYNDVPMMGSNGMNSNEELNYDGRLFTDPDLKIIYRLSAPDADTIGWQAAPLYRSSAINPPALTTITGFWSEPRSIGWGAPPPDIFNRYEGFNYPSGIIIHSFTLELGN